MIYGLRTKKRVVGYAGLLHGKIKKTGLSFKKEIGYKHHYVLETTSYPTIMFIPIAKIREYTLINSNGARIKRLSGKNAKLTLANNLQTLGSLDSHSQMIGVLAGIAEESLQGDTINEGNFSNKFYNFKEEVRRKETTIDDNYLSYTFEMVAAKYMTITDNVRVFIPTINPNDIKLKHFGINVNNR